MNSGWILFIFFGLFQSTGVLLVKKAMLHSSNNLLQMITTPALLFRFMLGGVFYLLTLWVWILCLSRFPITIAYSAAVSLAIIMTTLTGMIFFKESINNKQKFGIAIILAGVILLLH